jgi:hypothetical protein
MHLDVPIRDSYRVADGFLAGGLLVLAVIVGLSLRWRPKQP